MMLTANNEQRLFNRMKINSKVILATPETRVEGICRNISAQGALMEIAQGQCKVGEEWQLVVPSPDNNVPPLKAKATVLRVESGENADIIALTLTDVS